MNNSFIVEAIRSSLGEAYLVGGAIRDSLIGADTIKDYDFATPLSVEDIIAKLTNDGYDVVDYSAKYGTVSTKIAQTPVEITTFRKEDYSGSTQPSIEFISDIYEDLSRRDFTMNAIAHDGGAYIDPFDGQSDIINRRIRSVGDASIRFEEDPARILRALRFVSELGFSLTRETYDALAKNASLLTKVSADRVRGEFDRILLGPHWIQAVSLLIELDIMPVLFDISLSDDVEDQFIEIISSANVAEKNKYGRYRYFIRSLIAAMNYRNTHVNNLKVMNDVFSKFRDRLNWSAAFTETLYGRLKNEVEDESIHNLELQFKVLTDADDPSSSIVHEKLLKIKLRQSFSERNFEQANKYAKELVAVQDTNVQYRMNLSHDPAEKLKESLPYILSTFRYICAYHVHKLGAIDSKAELVASIASVLKRKDIFDSVSFEIGDVDRLETIERSLFMLNGVLNGRAILLEPYEILDMNTTIPRTDDRLFTIKALMIKELIRVRKQPYSKATTIRRYELCKMIADITIEKNHGVPTAEYYSYLSDHYKWFAASTSDIGSFWTYYEKMNEMIDNILEFKNLGEYYGEDSPYIDNATILTYALQLSESVDEKISLARNIVANYGLVKHKTNRHKARYQLLLDWLVLGNKVINATVDKSEAILAILPTMRSFRYKDVDEEFVALRMPEIETVRSDLYDFEAFLSVLNGIHTDIEIHDPSVASVAGLLTDKFITKDVAYGIYSAILTSKLTQGVPFEPLSLVMDASVEAEMTPLVVNQNLELISGGESDQVEFKQSWRYDIRKKQIDSTRELMNGAIRTIVAFMNTDGGTLFVGVHDHGEVTGLETADFLLYQKKGSQLGIQDEFKKNIDNALNAAIGPAASTLTKTSFDYVDGKTFAIIEVQKSSVDTFFNDRFYVRNAASTRELSVKDYRAFIDMRS